MLKSIHTKPLIIIGLTVLLMAMVLILFFNNKPTSPPSLLLSTPTNGQENVLPTSEIDLKFGKPVETSVLTITSTPAEEWLVSKGSDPQTVIVKSRQYLRPDTEYVLYIAYNSLPLAELRFKTMRQQGDARYTQQVLKDMDRDYPLAIKFPHSTPAYRVVYSAPLTLEITLKSSAVTQDQAISEVRAWVTQNGGDASKHQYAVIPYSP